jgi:hypothetical protein
MVLSTTPIRISGFKDGCARKSSEVIGTVSGLVATQFLLFNSQRFNPMQERTVRRGNQPFINAPGETHETVVHNLIVASYSLSSLDRGGWENTLMTNSNYTAANPLMAVSVGSGVTTPVAPSIEAFERLAQL